MRILPGDYSFEISKNGNKKHLKSISLEIGGTLDSHEVVLAQNPIPVTPLLVVGLVISLIGLRLYPTYKERIKTGERASEPNTDIMQHPSNIHYPIHFGTDKGETIKALFNEGPQTLLDLKLKTYTPENEFWDALYKLLSDEELKSDEQGRYLLTEKTEQDWGKHFNSLGKTDNE